MTRLSLLVPLLCLTIGVASCDTAARLHAVDGATGISDAGALPDSAIADMAAPDDTGTVADAAPPADIESTADAAPAADIESMADAAPAADLSDRADTAVMADGPTTNGGAGGDDGATVSTLAIDFTDPGAHVFAAQWLVFQPDESGTVDVQTEISSSWSMHPRAVEAQSLSLCGTSLNEAESVRNLEAAGFPESANPPLSNMRSVQISEVSPIAFCTGVHHASGTWTFIHDPVLPTLDAASGLAIGTMTMSEDDVDLVAVLFDGDSVVRTLQYQTSP